MGTVITVLVPTRKKGGGEVKFDVVFDEKKDEDLFDASRFLQ